jgi:hypothetical protein
LGQVEVAAQSSLVIRGRVVNGTADGPLPEGLEITLRFHDFRGDLAVRTTVASGDAFDFPDLVPATGEGYRLEVVYEGVAYSLEVPADAPLEPVVLMVYETTGDPSVLSGTDSTLVLGRGDEAGRSVGVLAVVQLENRSDRTFVASPGASAPMDLLRFSLPAGAQDLDVQTFLEGGHLLRVDRGFALTTPVPPGVHDILFTYLAPYDGDVWAFDHGFPLGAGVFRIMVTLGLGVPESEGMLSLPPVVVAGTGYTVLEARDLAPRDRLLLRLTGLSQPSLWARLQRSLGDARFQRGLAPGVLGAALLGLLGFVLISHRRRLWAHRPGSGGSRGTSVRRTLVERIAALDQLRAEGGVGEASYLEEREELKTRLMAMTEGDERP